MVPQEIIKVVKKFIKAAQKADANIDQVYIFGSQVRGTANKWSDIDVAIISPSFEEDRHEWGVKLLTIAMKIDSRIEPIPFESKSFAEDNWIPLIYEIKKNGVSVDVAA